jgi:hypothetical protein
MNKILKKYMIPEVTKGRINPIFDDDRLIGFYLKRTRAAVHKKFFSDEAWNYLCNYFGIKDTEND